MKKATLLILSLSLISATLIPADLIPGDQAAAQIGARDPKTPTQTRVAGGFPSDSTKLTETVKCTIVAVRQDGKVVVRDDGENREHALRFADKLKITAQKRKDFDGRKKLEISDLEVDQRLQVIRRLSSGEVVKVKVLKSSR